MGRIQSTWMFCLLMVIVAACVEHAFAKDSSPSPHPNIVYILADDLGYGDVQALNPRRCKIDTPHIDHLAAQSMVFTDAHSGSSVCTPTRYGILTGRYAWRTRLQRSVLGGVEANPLIAPDRLTVAELLRQQGYHTAALGKWHLGFKYASDVTLSKQPPKLSAGAAKGARIVNGPITRGFDYFFGFGHGGSMRTLIENDRVVQADAEPVSVLPSLAEQAKAYIAQRADATNADEPFFLYLALNSPHTPLVPSSQWQGRSPLGKYGDFVMQTDDVVGQILDALNAQRLVDNTLVIFTSDNGCAPYIGVKRLEQKGHYPSARFRGYKSDIWDGGHRIPFMVRWPGHVEPGSKTDQLVCLTDLMATCADILNVKLPDNVGVDSVSILPILRGQATQPIRGAVVHHSIKGKFAIRQGAWKLAFCAGSGGWTEPKDKTARKRGLPPIQLYRMQDGVGEQINVQAEHAPIVRRLTDLMVRYVDAGRSTPGAEQPNDVEVKVNLPDLRDVHGE